MLKMQGIVVNLERDLKILVYGLGGVGGYIAAYLSQTQNEVTGVARGEHLQEIQRNGLRIIEDTKEFTAHFEAVDDSGLRGIYDIAIFCTKSYDLKEAVLTCQPFLNSQSVVLSLSNGVEHGNTLRTMLDVKVLDGCIYILSHIQSSGVIRRLGDVFALVFGGEDAQKLADVMDAAGLRYKVPENIEEAIWKKYIFISAFAILTSYYNESIRTIYENRYEEAHVLLKEVALVASAKGININEEVEKSLITASKLPYDASTSMHKDIKAKKKDELQTLCGYLVKEAETLEVEVPKLKYFYDELLKVHH